MFVPRKKLGTLAMSPLKSNITSPLAASNSNPLSWLADGLNVALAC